MSTDQAEQAAPRPRRRRTAACVTPDRQWTTPSVQGRADLPRLIRAGRHIARPRRYIRDLGIEVEPDELVAEVEKQAARGDGWVKIVGDWIDRSTGDLAPLWPDAVLREAIGRAHQLGSRVATHVFGEDALAGPGSQPAVDSIEHGTGLTGRISIAAVAAQRHRRSYQR